MRNQLIHKSIALGMTYTHTGHFYKEPEALKPALVDSLHYAGQSTVKKPFDSTFGSLIIE